MKKSIFMTLLLNSFAQAQDWKVDLSSSVNLPASNAYSTLSTWLWIIEGISIAGGIALIVIGSKKLGEDDFLEGSVVALGGFIFALAPTLGDVFNYN